MYGWLKDYRKLEEQIAYLEFNLSKTKRELRRWENPYEDEENEYFSNVKKLVVTDQYKERVLKKLCNK